MGAKDEKRDLYLRAQIEPGERILAAGPQAYVTDRRILFGWRLRWPPYGGQWAHDALAFDEITQWSEGRRHDGRPLLRLEHPLHRRLRWVPAHRVLWFRWGNATSPTSHHETSFSFRHRRDPVFRIMKEKLELSEASHGEPFFERLPGTRAERLGESVLSLSVIPTRSRRLRWLRGRIAKVDERLHHGHITWWIRVASWMLLAVPAGLLTPWLIVPAVLIVEIAWVVGLQWSWRHERNSPQHHP